MTNEQEERLRKAKLKLANKPKTAHIVVDRQSIEDLKTETARLATDESIKEIKAQEASNSQQADRRLDDIEDKVDGLSDRLNKGIEVTNLEPHPTPPTQIKVTNLDEIKVPQEITVKNQLALPEWIKTDKSILGLVKQIQQLEDVISNPKQRPENFIPVRIVKPFGNKLDFDNRIGGDSGGGGGSSSSSGSGGTVIIQDAGGEQATVTGGKLDVNASIDTTGLALAAKQDTGNTSLASIDTKLSGSIAVTGTFWQATQPISAAALPLPAGASTSAKQDTGNTSLASIDGKITAVNTGAVVVSSSALPTGASTSAKQDTGNTSLASIDGKITAVNTGAVVVASGSITANAGANLNTSALALDATLTGVIKAEDAASASADKGIPALAIQTAAPADTAGTDLDYSMLQMAGGRLWVDASGKTLTVGSHAVTNAGTFAVQAAEADGANVTLGAKADAKSTATDTTAITAMSVLKQISASVQAPPSQAVTNAGTFAVQAAATEADGANVTLGAKADAKSTATDTTAITVMSVLKQISASVQAPPTQAVTNAGTFATQPTIQTGSAQIGHLEANQSSNVSQINGVTPLMGAGNTGTGSLRVTVATDQATLPISMATNTPLGNIAHDGVDSGAPVKIGFKAETQPSTITAVADGDRTDGYADADGLQMTKPYTSYADIISERVSNTNGTSTAFANFTAVSATRNYLSTITVYNTSATDGFVDIRDGTAGAVLHTCPCPAGGGSTINFPVPLRQPTANAALAFDVSGALTTVYISAVGFQSKL